MKKYEKKILYMIIFVLIVMLAGVSYAYFTASVSIMNEENKITEIGVAKLVDVTMDYGNKIEASGVLPGYKTIKTIGVRGMGTESAIPVTIAITLTPHVADFFNHVKYTIYEVENSKINLTDICTPSNKVNTEGKYYDAMSCDTTVLGSPIKEGIFIDQKVVSQNVEVKYNTDKTFYVLVEYLNDENSQDEEQGKTFRINLGYENEAIAPNLVEYLIEKSKKENATIVKITHGSTIQTGENALVDYRYVGANPNNYVYFGCNEECTEENLYRIIGVIPTQSSEDGPYENRVKLIKASNYTEQESGLVIKEEKYQWNITGNNKWEDSSLQKKVLNGIFWNNLGEYKNFISPAKWYLGNPYDVNYNVYTPNQFYYVERSDIQGLIKGQLSFVASIGLMYPSDYGYSSGNKDEAIYNKGEEYIYNAWLNFGKQYEWTISAARSVNSSTYSWTIAPFMGYVNLSNVDRETDVAIVRPTFYLKKDIILSNGKGTKEDPYRISLGEI